MAPYGPETTRRRRGMPGSDTGGDNGGDCDVPSSRISERDAEDLKAKDNVEKIKCRTLKKKYINKSKLKIFSTKIMLLDKIW